MDTLITTALVGTGQQGNLELTTGTPIDALLAQTGEGNAERRLLLAAGAWSIYRRAGQAPVRLTQEDSAEQPVQPAPPETLAACSPTIVSALEEVLLGQFDGIVIEVATRLREAGQRLPHALLPSALYLGTQKEHLRAALAPVLGERGRWLGQFKPKWAWVNEFLPGDERTLPKNAEILWQEGMLASRHALLRRLRGIDPGQARQWLADVWKQEKVDARCTLLATFEVGLSPEDEPFLEKALDDRSERVRAIAAPLLARLPTSALAQRMRARADRMLNYAAGALTIRLPIEQEIDQTWQRDGVAPATAGKVALSWPLTQVLSLVPPSYWEQRFSLSPDVLIALAEAAEDGQRAIDSWSYAAMLFADVRWAAALWRWTCAHIHSGAVSIRDMQLADVRKALATLIPRREAEQCVEQLPAGSEEWQLALELLPDSWSEESGESYLQVLRAYLDDALAAFQQQRFSSWSSQHSHMLPYLQKATFALPYACLAKASMQMEPYLTLPLEALSHQARWYVMSWQQELETFIKTIRLRKRLLEEIHA
jgi:hypothetical protein